MPVVECVPNISEGRRTSVIDACAAAIRQTGAALLDTHSDAAHDRSVFTIAGIPSTVVDAVLALFDAAIANIDLRLQHGVHPRLGAVDVVPFVPIRDATLEDCVDLARRTAAAVSSRHGLPVYLYEAAAARPERRRLELVRRGGFEGLALRMADPADRPDFGPARPHPTAGASIIGARGFLVAFNVNLAVDDLDAARAIARSVRQSSGGLPGVKALGLPLVDRGISQVSMNLTDIDRTPLHVAYAALAAEAARLGVPLGDNEIVGLAPAVVFEQAATHGVPLVRAGHVLEERLAAFGLIS